MEAKIPTLKNFLGGVLFGLVVLTVMFATVGCSKKDKGGTRAYPPGHFGPGFSNFPGFPGNPGGGMPFGQFLGNDSQGRFQLAIQLSGNPYGQGGTWAYGELFIAQGLTCNGIYGFGMAPGAYQVQSIQPAVMSGDWLQGMVLQAYGPGGSAIVTVTDAKLMSIGGQGRSCSGYVGYDELIGIVRIDAVNNQPCGTTSYVDLQTSYPVCGY